MTSGCNVSWLSCVADERRGHPHPRHDPRRPHPRSRGASLTEFPWQACPLLAPRFSAPLRRRSAAAPVALSAPQAARCQPLL